MRKNKIFWFLVSSTVFYAAYHNVGYYHPDEYYQILEFAGYWSGIVKAEWLPWEFHHQMRPSLQPFIAYVFHQLTILLYGEHQPALWTFSLRLLSGLFSFFVIYHFVRLTEKKFDFHQRKWLWIYSFFTWFVVFLMVRFNSEAWSGLSLLMALFYLNLPSRSLRRYFWAGVWLGLAFEFRYQLAVATLGILGWLLWFEKENKFSKLLYLIAGGALVLVFATLLDSIFYQRFVIVPYHYFYQNIVLKKVNFFGQEPWYFYFQECFKSRTFVLNSVYLVSLLYFIYRYPKDLITWAIVPFFAIHLMIAHKEWRFLYPIFFLLPYFLLTFFRDISLTAPKMFKIGLLLLFLLQLPALYVTVNQYLLPNILVYEWIWRNRSVQEPTIIYFKEHFYDKPCLKYQNKDPKTQCLRHNVHLNNAQIFSWYYCEGDTIVFHPEKYRRMLVVYYAFKDKKNIPSSYRRVYSFYPEWVLRYFNINNWASRTSFLEIYEYEAPEKPESQDTKK